VKSQQSRDFPELHRLIEAHKNASDKIVQAALLGSIHEEQDKVNEIIRTRRAEWLAGKLQPTIITLDEQMSKNVYLSGQTKTRVSQVKSKPISQENSVSDNPFSELGSEDCSDSGSEDGSLADTDVLDDFIFTLPPQVVDFKDGDELFKALITAADQSTYHQSKLQYAQRKLNPVKTNQKRPEVGINPPKGERPAAGPRSIPLGKPVEAKFECSDPFEDDLTRLSTVVAPSQDPIRYEEETGGLLRNRERRNYVCVMKKYKVDRLEFFGKWNHNLLAGKLITTHYGVHFMGSDSYEIELPATLVGELSEFFAWQERDYDTFTLGLTKARQFLYQCKNINSEQQEMASVYATYLAFISGLDHHQNAARLLHGSYWSFFGKSCDKSRRALSKGGWKYLLFGGVVASVLTVSSYLLAKCVLSSAACAVSNAHSDFNSFEEIEISYSRPGHCTLYPSGPKGTSTPL